MKIFKRLVMAVGAVVIAVATITPALPVSAAGSASLSIPPKKNYVVDPGDGIDDTLTIRNLDDTEDLELNLRVIDFTFTGDGGTPKLMLDESAPQTTWSLKPFLSVPEFVSIPAGKTKTFDLNLSIPSNQGAGSYYSAIIYSTGAPEGGNVGLAASGVTLVFATVPGEVTENLELKKFGAYAPASQTLTNAKYVYFTTEKPLNIAYTLENKGNVAESPVGAIKMRWMFGKEKEITQVNPSGSLALIGQTRTFQACIKLKSELPETDTNAADANTCVMPDLWPGYYSLSLDLYYGQNGNLTQEIIGRGGFWYLPVWFIVVFIVFLLALALFVWRTYEKLRRRMYGSKLKKSLKRRR